MNSLLLAIKSEHYKSAKTAAFWGAIIIPFFIVLAISLGVYYKTDNTWNGNPFQHWMKFISQSLSIMGSFIIPLFCVFVGYAVNNIEHRSDMWKSLFTLPISRFKLYAGKVIYSILLIYLALLCFIIFTYLAGTIMSKVNPEYFHFNQYPIFIFLIALQLKFFFSSLAILAVQFVCSILWRNFLIPLGIGFLGIILGNLLAVSQLSAAKFFPYAQPMYSILSMKLVKQTNSVHISVFTPEIMISIISAMIIF